MSSYSRQQLEEWLKTLGAIVGKVLDIGGSQLPVIKRLNNTDLFIDEYKILDLEKPHEQKEPPDIIFDLNYNPEISFLNKEYNSLDKYGKFDIAFCLEVSEYWFNPVQALANINFMLVDGGILYISFHFNYPVHNPVDQDYLRYTPRGVEKLLEATGFEILEMKPRLEQSDSSAFQFYMNEKMKPAKGYDKHAWTGCLVKCKKL